MAAVRRSARIKELPQKPAEPVEDSDVEDEALAGASDSDGEGRALRPAKKQKGGGKKKQAAAPKKQQGKRAAADGADGEADGEDEENDAAVAAGASGKGAKAAAANLSADQAANELFATVCASGAKASELKRACAEWSKGFDRDAEAGIRELVAFFLLSSGAKNLKKVEAVLEDGGDIDDVIAATVEAMSVAGGGDDVWATKNKRNKKFRPGFLAVWAQLVGVLDGGSALDSRLLHEKEDGGSEPSQLLETIVAFVTAASGQGPRDMRMAATHATVELTSALIGVATRITEARTTLDRQASSKTGKAKGSAASLKAEAARLDDRLETIHGVMDSLFTGVFTHRFRDVDARVRAACQEGLGRWVGAYPVHFFTESKLKYNAWLLSDDDAHVRLASLTALESIVDDLEDYAQQLEGYVTRFGSRLLQATNDVDVGVAAKAIGVLGGLLRAELVTEDEVLPEMYPLLLDDSVQVRRAAATVLKEHYLDEVSASKADAGQRKKKGKAAAGGAAKDELCGIVDIAEELCEGQVQVTMLVDAMWDVADSLRDWPALIELLGDDNDEALEGIKRVRLAQVLSVAVRKASGAPVVPGEKAAARAFSKKTAANEKARKDATANLLEELPELLDRLGEDEDIVGALADIVPHLDLEMYGSAGEQSTAEDLAKALRSALKRHSDRAVLESCGRALRALENTDACASTAPVVIKGAVTDLSGAVRKAANKVLRGDTKSDTVVALIAALRRMYTVQRSACARLGAARAPVSTLLARIASDDLEVDAELTAALIQSTTAEVFLGVSPDSKDDVATVSEWAGDLVDATQSLCASPDEKVRVAASSSLSDMLVLFGKCAPEGQRIQTTAEMCGKLWHACSETIKSMADKKGEGDSAKAAYRAALQCAGRPVFANAVETTEAVWLMSRLLSIWPDDDSKETQNVMKCVCARLARSDYVGSWRAYSDALKLAFDIYASAIADGDADAAEEAISRVTKLATNINKILKEQNDAFGKRDKGPAGKAAANATKAVADRVLLDGVDFAFEDVPTSLLYLVAALHPLVGKASAEGSRRALDKLEAKMSTAGSEAADDNKNEWEAVEVFKASLEEQAAKAPPAVAAAKAPAAVPAPAAELPAPADEPMAEDVGGEAEPIEETPLDAGEGEEVGLEDEATHAKGRKKASVGVMVDEEQDGASSEEEEVPARAARATRGKKRVSPAKEPAPARYPKRRR